MGAPDYLQPQASTGRLLPERTSEPSPADVVRVISMPLANSMRTTTKWRAWSECLCWCPVVPLLSAAVRCTAAAEMEVRERGI